MSTLDPISSMYQPSFFIKKYIQDKNVSHKSHPEKNLHWPVLSYTNKIVLNEKNTLKKIIKIAFSIIFVPLALFLDLIYNTCLFFASKLINFINSKKKKETKAPISFFKRVQTIWKNHQKLILISFAALTTAAIIGYFYSSIKPFIDINIEYNNWRNKAKTVLNGVEKRKRFHNKRLAEQRTEAKSYERIIKLNERSLKIRENLLSEESIALTNCNRRLAQCKKDYNSSFTKIVTKSYAFKALIEYFRL